MTPRSQINTRQGKANMNHACQSNLIHRSVRITASWLLPLLLLALPAAVQAQFIYTINNGTVTITGYTGPGGAVTIPDTISGLPVTSIGTNAFYACTNLNSVTIPNSVSSIRVAAFYYCISLTSVTIPNSVTSIGDEAFGYCSRLTSVTIPYSVTSIGSFVFNSCTGLTSITIPYSVTSIGDYAFWNCTSLTSITVDTLNSAYSSVDGVLFNKTQTTLVQYPAGIAATSYTIPNGVTSIGNWAFGYCSSLTDLTIPNSVTSIRAYAFEVCTSLTSVTIGSGVTSIENLAFYSCTSLTALHFRGNAPSLGGSEVFQGDNHATVYYLPGTTGWGATFGGLPTALWQLPPGAWTSSASTITPSGATLNGTVNPNGWPTTAWFQWGDTTNYGNLTSVTNLGSGITALPLSVPIAGLTLNVTYHFRIAATNDNGLAYGNDQSFTTSLSPTVTTLPVTDVSTNNATLNGMVNPNGWPTTAWFQWGATTNYGNLTPVADLGSGTTTLPSSAQLASLTPSVTYHFRVAATNDYGLVYGSDQSFTTAPHPFTDANWVSLGAGMIDHVMVLAVSGTNLYAGGWFTTAGGLTVNRIAKWDGSAWSALGSGMMNRDVLAAAVFALAVSGTDLYAGGQFTTAGGVPANNIAKWDGSAWSPLGSGITDDYDVEALAVSGTNTYAGGFFPSAGGVPATNIAKWNGSAWSALGSGMNYAGDVWALAVSGTNLYAGGPFTTAGGVAANFIAKWDGRAWSALGSGMNNSVVALAVSGNNLYAGGKFTMAGSVPANHVAKWDGNAWSALGSGVDDYVNALAVSGTDLYAGGWFTTAGGVPANYIAKWDGRAWSALGSGMDGVVEALAADGAGHLFVAGGFTYAGTNVSPDIAEANLDSAPTVLTPPPGAWTLSASTITTTGAMLNGTVNPNGYPSTAWFHWGATTNYGNFTSMINLGSGTNALPFSAPLAGLAPGVTYHFRVAATNDYGLVYGSDQSFTTLGLPQISTLPATDVSPNSATLNGTVNPNGYPTTAWFQWGTTTNYGNLTSVTNLGSGTIALPLSAPLTGLTPSVTYHFRVAATNDNGVVYGSDQSFTTEYAPLPATVTIDLVPVGNPGNAADPRTGYGAVNYNYAIGTCEVTAAQYCEFLNAKAKSDPHELYNDYMASIEPWWPWGCDIQRLGTSGSYEYTVPPDYANRPVNCVNFWSACRFVNWLSNGQGNGDTETGTYTLNGYDGYYNPGIQRNAGATWVVPTQDEWYKAAYYDPNKAGGPGYWLYPTKSDVAPGRDMTEATNPGNNANSFSFSADAAYPIDSGKYYTTIVGEFQLSASPYGTFDQGGNVWEWTDTVVDSLNRIRGGSFYGDTEGGTYGPPEMQSTFYHDQVPLDGAGALGFRVGLVATATSLSPTVMTLSATAIAAPSATLNGTVNPNGSPTTAWFQWGATTNYGNLTSTTALGSGTTALPLSVPLAGLTPSVTYHFRLAATNDYGLAYGSDQSFTTQAQSGDAGWTLNGGATMTGNTIALTVGALDTSRSAFLNNKQDVTAFHIVFFYQDVSGAGSADGVTFCIQNDPRGATALGGGSGGSSLGYENITPSVALAMNIFDPYTRGIAFAQNGMRVTPYQSLLPNVDIGGNTNIIQVNVDYNGTVMTMTFKDTVTGGIASTNWTVNIPSVVGGSTAYVGFTGADGGVASIQTISWVGSTPTILIPPRTQTAEAGSAVGLSVRASGALPLSFLWYLNYTNLLSYGTNWELEATNVQFSQIGTYTVVISNVLGAITSSPAMLNVIAPVERRPVPGVKVTGDPASVVNVDYANSLSPAPNWTPLGSVSLTSTSQYCLDLTMPLPPQRFYRAWQTETLSVMPSLDLHMIPAITLTGSIGGSVRLDYINKFGLTDAWVTLDLLTLTNTSQLYFDVSAPGHPQRLYRLIP
jgi:formylglycine-generating enzyme required for sulfatase activity